MESHALCVWKKKQKKQEFILSSIKQLSRTKVLAKLEETKGKEFTARFIKRDGTLREMRAFISDPEPGAGPNKVMKENNAYITVRSVGDGNAYRTVNLSTLKSIQILGETYKIVD